MKKSHLQLDQPLFIRDRYHPVKVSGKVYKYQQHFPWKETGVSEEVVMALFETQRVYHNRDLEVASGFVSVSVLTPTNLDKLINLVNAKIKDLTPTNQEYNKRKIKHSKIREKQEGLCRTWRNTNEKWPEMADFYDQTLRELYDTQGTPEAE